MGIYRDYDEKFYSESCEDNDIYPCVFFFFLHSIVTPSTFFSALNDTIQGFTFTAGVRSEDEEVEKLIVYKYKILAYLVCCAE